MVDSTKEISINDLCRTLWSYKWLILICTVVLTAVFFIKSAFFTADTYTSTGMLYVSNQMTGMTSGNYAMDISDIESSRSMVTTCMELINTRTYLDYVSHTTGQKYTWEEIGGMLSMSPVNETELLSISVTTGNPDDSYDIADAIIQKAPSQLGTIFTTGTIEIIDEPVYPDGPNGNGIAKNTGIGFIGGFVLGAALAFLLNLFDKKVHVADELTAKFDIPILGEIEG